MNTLFACSAGNPEMLLFPALVGAGWIAAGLIAIVGVVLNLGSLVEEKGRRDASGGPPPLP